MPFLPNNIYHVYNQGNNRQTIFLNGQDYLIFLNLYKRLFSDNCSTIAWCLMPNHFHFMIYTDERCDAKIKQGGIFLDPVTNSIRKLLSGYARIFNNKYKQTGSVFRQKTKAKCLSEIEIKPDSKYLIQDYYVNCFHYIHQNPVVAKLTERLEDWEFSSFQDYAGIRNGVLCKKDLAITHCNYTPENFIEKSYELVDKKIIELFI
jgi:putative transposase